MFNPMWELALPLTGSVEPDKQPTVVWPTPYQIISVVSDKLTRLRRKVMEVDW